VLREPLHAGSIMTDERVMRFAANEMDEDEMTELLEASRLKQLLIHLQTIFSFAELTTYITGLRKELEKRKTGPREENLDTQIFLYETFVAAQVHAARFGEQLAQLVPRGDMQAVAARVQAAFAYFREKVFAPCLERIAAHRKLLDNFPKVAKQTRQWRDTEMTVKTKLADMEKALEIISHEDSNTAS